MQTSIFQEQLQLQLPVNQKARNLLADVETKVVFSNLTFKLNELKGKLLLY